MIGTKYLHLFSCLRKGYIGRWRRGGKGHRNSGDTAGSSFETGDSVKEKLGEATVVRLGVMRRE